MRLCFFNLHRIFLFSFYSPQIKLNFHPFFSALVFFCIFFLLLQKKSYFSKFYMFLFYSFLFFTSTAILQTLLLCFFVQIMYLFQIKKKYASFRNLKIKKKTRKKNLSLLNHVIWEKHFSHIKRDKTILSPYILFYLLFVSQHVLLKNIITFKVVRRTTFLENFFL